ncbi:MAG: DHH family phosphoesterase [Patescibacteria group bacterium]
MTLEQTNKKIFEMITGAQRILLLTDERIDGDTTGSTLAMYHWLNGLGKDVRVFSPKPWTESYLTLPGSENVIFDSESSKQPADIVMIFDCADGKYLRELSFTTPSALDPSAQPPLIVFDHHATNPHYGTINQIVVEASSTGEVVWQFFKHNRVTITKDMATCLLTAICTDTTLFTNLATNHICMEAAAELGLAGAKMQDIVRIFYMNRSVDALRLWGTALERLQELPQRLIYTCLTQKDISDMRVQEDQVEGISNFLIGMIMDAQIVCVLREKTDGSVKGSLRTLTGNVAQIAQRLGGGGHIKAAGFTIEKARLQEQDGVWSVRWDSGEIRTVERLLQS